MRTGSLPPQRMGVLITTPEDRCAALWRAELDRRERRNEWQRAYNAAHREPPTRRVGRDPEKVRAAQWRWRERRKAAS